MTCPNVNLGAAACHTIFEYALHRAFPRTAPRDQALGERSHRTPTTQRAVVGARAWLPRSVGRCPRIVVGVRLCHVKHCALRQLRSAPRCKRRFGPFSFRWSCAQGSLGGTDTGGEHVRWYSLQIPHTRARRIVVQEVDLRLLAMHGRCSAARARAGARGVCRAGAGVPMPGTDNIQRPVKKSV